jgi:hypothetical protein
VRLGERGLVAGVVLVVSLIGAPALAEPPPLALEPLAQSDTTRAGLPVDVPRAEAPSLLDRAARTFAQAASTPGLAPSPARPTRSARLFAEGVTGAGLGLVLPFAAYGGLTALQSFVGFFTGFLSATVLAVVLAPIGIVIAGRLMGAEGGTGRAVIGALLGLLAGVLIGLPLATLPGAGYLVGLALFWALPAVGTLVAFEWGRAEAPPAGAVVLRF